jgi:N-acetyl-anhydromuramyl-L-alanine amidase AmpD
MLNKIIFIGNENTNYSSRRGIIPDVIVNHISEGSKESCISWFTSQKNKNSSAHFLVDKEGKIFQFVNIENMAWGNGLYIRDIKKSSSELVRSRNINPNRYTISIEHEGIYKETRGALTKAQLEGSIWLHRYIIDYVDRRYKKKISINRNHIIGHCEIDPIRKPLCPGEAFPYEEIISKINDERKFSDIKDHWAEKEIKYLIDKNILEGFPDGTFRPNEYITRGEVAYIVKKIIKDDA